jgi:hypothetical protein
LMIRATYENEYGRGDIEGCEACCRQRPRKRTTPRGTWQVGLPCQDSTVVRLPLSGFGRRDKTKNRVNGCIFSQRSYRYEL